MTRQSMILGTPGYLAPEQLAGADPDPRQDLYAVGAVAAELLTGERPGPDGKLPMPVGPLADFIHHLTAPDPSARPISAAAAAQLLASATTNTPHSWPTAPDAPEVFDQLPPLPPPWTPRAPDHPRAANRLPATDLPVRRLLFRWVGSGDGGCGGWREVVWREARGCWGVLLGWCFGEG